RHLPLAAQRVEHALRRPAQTPLLVGAPDAPHRMEISNEAPRDEDRPRAGELSVVHVAAPQHLVLQHPRLRRFGILLRVARHHRVAASADGDVERRAWTARVGQARRETGALDEALRVERRFDAPRLFALPSRIAVVLGLIGQLYARHERSWYRAR